MLGVLTVFNSHIISQLLNSKHAEPFSERFNRTFHKHVSLLQSDDDVCTSYLADQARRDELEVVAAHDFFSFNIVR